LVELVAFSGKAIGIDEQEKEEHNLLWFYRRALSTCEEPLFQSAVGVVIAFNAVVIGAETDFPDLPVWPLLEHTFLVIFVTELVLRLAHNGLCLFFTHEDDWAWNGVDFIIVAGGIVDMWLMPLYGALFNVSFTHNKLLQLVRMMRLLRLVKLLRQLKQVRKLYELALAVVHATAALGWVLLLTCIFLYIFAIVCTQLIGQGQALPDDMKADLAAYAAADEVGAFTRRLAYRPARPHFPRRLQEEDDEPDAPDAGSLDPIELRMYFGTIPDSMYTLFELIAGWALQPFDELLTEVPWLKPIFIVFWIFTSWALLSVMTGAVAEGMISTKAEEMSSDVADKEEQKKQFAEGMRQIAVEADTDGGGTIDKEEFEALRLSDKWLELQELAGVDAAEIENVFDCLLESQVTLNGSPPSVSIDEFVAGFLQCHEPPAAVSLLRIECDMKFSHQALEATVSSIDNQLKGLQGTMQNIVALAEKRARERGRR